MRQAWGGSLIIALALAACATVEPARPPETSTKSPQTGPPGAETTTSTVTDTPVTDQPPSTVSVDFFDARSFDKKLAKALRKTPPEATVRFLAPVTVNDIPDRLEAWLAAVEKYDGTITVEVDPHYRQRDLFSSAFSIVAGTLFGLYQTMVKNILYSPAKHYDAMIYYNGDTGNITRVVFRHKPASS